MSVVNLLPANKTSALDAPVPYQPDVTIPAPVSPVIQISPLNKNLYGVKLMSNGQIQGQISIGWLSFFLAKLKLQGKKSHPND